MKNFVCMLTKNRLTIYFVPTLLVLLILSGVGCTGEEPSAPPVNSGGKPVFTDPYTGMEFVLVKGGTFDMGDIFGDAVKIARPVHKVTVSDFYIARYEVTQAQWEKLMGSNPSSFKGPNNPVDSVSYNDIQEFIKRLNKKTGQSYRLPTEAEWEYAARSGGKREKWSGTNNIEEVGDYAWYARNSNGMSHPVGTKKPNGLGLYDMSGNLWEWVNDMYTEAYPSEPQVNPKGPNSTKWGYYVYRGGAWDYTPRIITTTERSGKEPDHRRNWIGFRLGKDAP